MSDDELRSELNHLADRVEVSPVTLDQVQARGRRRTRYQRGAVLVAAFALVVGGTVAVTSITGDGDGEGDVATEETDADVTNADGATGDDTDGGADGADAEEADRAELETATTTTIPIESLLADGGIDAFSEFSDGPPQVVAWGEGFLSFGSRWIETDSDLLASEFGTTEVADAFSQEVIDAIESAGDVSLESEEVEAALEAAGVIDEASQVVFDDPEVMEWFMDNVSGGRTETTASFSTDGVDWTPLEDFAWPGGGGWVPQLASNGRHLVAAVTDFGSFRPGAVAPTQTVSVHITSDLVNWIEVPLPIDQADLSPYLQANLSPGELALGDQGWYLAVSSWQWLDIRTALPAEVLAEVDENFYSLEPTPAGIEIQDWSVEPTAGPTPTTTTTLAADTDAAPSPDDAAPVDAAPFEQYEPVVVRTVPWSDMPFTYADYQGYNSADSAQQWAFTGDFEGNLVTADVPGDPEDISRVVATEDGFFMAVTDYAVAEGANDLGFENAEPPVLRGFTSPDGRQWNETDLGLGEGVWLDSMAAVQDGILLSVSGTLGGQRYYLGEADGTGFAPVEGPGLDDVWVWFESTGGGHGVAAVVDVGQTIAPEYVAWTASFTYEGDDIEIVTDAEGTQSLSIVRNGETVIERTIRTYEEQLWEWVDDGIRFVDPDGVVEIEVPYDVAEVEIFQKETEAWEATWNDDPYEPDYRLVATRDGRSWIVVELSATDTGFSEYSWLGQPAINGDTVVVFDQAGNPLAVPLS
ncbi:MAG: hypothetical protein AAGA90_14625 [Actinomycetota bacterium]